MTPTPTIDTPSRITHCDLCGRECGLPHELVEGLAAQQARKWRRAASMIDPEDIRQEAWLSYFQHRKEIDRLIAKGEQRLAWMILRDDVWRYCRREKAHYHGYDPGDEYFYSLRALRTLLPGALGGDVAAERGMVAEPRRAPRGTVSGSDADTLHVDVRWGLSQLAADDRQLLFDVYGRGKGYTMHPDYARAKTALKRLQEVLGGPELGR